MRSIRMFLLFLQELAEKKSVVYELTKRDFRAVYMGSYLGIIWAFVLPVAMTTIFWFVFQVGYNTKPVDQYPYILWLVCGLFPWFFFNDCINNGTLCILQNSYAVKRVAFSIGILPIIKIFSGLIIHFFFILLIFGMFLYYGHQPDIYTIQVFYYLFALIVLVLGLTWLTSSIVIFFRDLRPLITILLQMGFYLTPVFWNLKILPEEYRAYISYNPVYYIVEGYRETFIYKIWFWENWRMALYFWSVTAVIFVAGALVFRRLRPHFADIL